MSNELNDGVSTARHADPGPPAGDGGTSLVDALVLLRARVDEVDLPLEGDGVEPARQARRQVLDQLDDYLLPRLRASAAPVLAVLGGSTGAGKSTLVNSLLGHEVSRSSVLRPTTRWPVLVHHPLDARWFTTDRVLPGLARRLDAPAGSSGAAVAPTEAGDGVGGLRLVASDALPQGLALLDAPDIDSLVEENRRLSRQLLGAADLWLFVTTAARYADAVPWELLQTAAERRVELALVLDRVDPGQEDVVGAHLRSMLAEHDLPGTTVLTVPEAPLEDGLLPTWAVAPLADWLTALAADPAARRDVVRRTRDGLLADLLGRSARLAAAADAQAVADARLRSAVESAYAAASADVRRATSDGTLLRGEVLARWQELVGTGELMRSVEQGVSRLRDRLGAALRGKPSAAPELQDAIGHHLDAVVLDAAETAAERAHAAWRSDPAGAALLEGLALSRASSSLRTQVAEGVRAWQGDVLALVTDEGSGRRTQARALSFGVNGLGAALMLVVFASTGGLTGAEVGIAGGSALLAQRLLEAVFGDDAVRRLTTRAQELLGERVDALLAAESRRFTAQLDALGTGGQTPGVSTDGARLREAVALVERSPLPEASQAPSAGAAGRLRGAGAAGRRPGGGEHGQGRDAREGGPDSRGAGDEGAATGLRGWWRRVTGQDAP
ncbi:dynamin family protein [Cellulomonas marina]|uniref:Dynamin family protein n=1 Tax=Cellulomonas marina TaxID=988821 RepID=A0A1I0V8K2_9CELL|nr:dynamin family protein [Cellulomonas marina]GIG29234.1 ABC transporter [Cellulomonas marina]SFA72383.1 Dynamin family protein [Cellulomonas marina]